MAQTFNNDNGVFGVEWFEEEGHVIDLAAISASDRAALEKLKELYDGLDVNKRHEMRGMLRLLEDGLTCSYILESAETLARIWEMMLPEQKMSMADFMSHCIASGGNWTQMLASGVKALWPAEFDGLPEKFTFKQVMDIVQKYVKIDGPTSTQA